MVAVGRDYTKGSSFCITRSKSSGSRVLCSLTAREDYEIKKHGLQCARILHYVSEQILDHPCGSNKTRLLLGLRKKSKTRKRLERDGG